MNNDTYQEMLLRWLCMKRDYPWNNEPEPVCDTPEKRVIRERTAREFNRTN